MTIIPLFERYPVLKERLPYVSLGEFPTPVQKLQRLGDKLSIEQLYIKRDDLSGKFYGGNKPRKLEFLLGNAVESKATEVITFGGIGSNHALATAIYAKQLGLKCTSMLIPQPNAYCVRRNLLMGFHSGAELHSCGTGLEKVGSMLLVYVSTLYQLLSHWIQVGRFPHLILPGGSSPLGVVGFVNAALELQEQIASGELPEPEYIYVPAGTMGTAAGLTLGLRVAGVRSQVVSVRITNEKLVNVKGMIKLVDKTNSLLCSLDSSFPRLEFSEADIDMRGNYFGGQYALYTEEGMQAISMMKDCEKIKLDGTYTGKTLAALIADANNGKLKNSVVLFWNTLNSMDFSREIASVDYHSLPRVFHRYFENDVQPLDSAD